jgi:hypothetical protein
MAHNFSLYYYQRELKIALVRGSSGCGHPPAIRREKLVGQTVGRSGSLYLDLIYGVFFLLNGAISAILAEVKTGCGAVGSAYGWGP